MDVASDMPSLPDAAAPKVAPWTPPQTGLSPEFVRAAHFLHDQGLADPRGGEYVRAKVILGSLSGRSEPIAIAGWYFRDRNELVALNGLIYEVVEVVGPLKPTYKPSLQRVDGILQIESGPNLIAAAMFLRVGNVRLAEQIVGPEPVQSPLWQLAYDYLWVRFERAVTAHIRGDHHLAYADAQELRRLWPVLEEKLGPLPPGYPRHSASTGRSVPQRLGFLEPIEKLAQDSWRRMQATRRPWIDPAKIEDQSERVWAIIADLENVSVPQFSQPGSVELALDERVQALLREGGAAVDPLIEVLLHDDRLTRSVEYGRDFFPHRTLLSVRSAAIDALEAILGLEPPRGKSPSELASFYRETWESTKHMTRAERWMYVLADEDAGPMRWNEVARNLMDPVGIERYGTRIQVPQRDPNAPDPPMQAEPLRSRREPSLSELLERRSIDSLNRTGGGQDYGWYGALIALALYQWDAEAALPALREAFRHTTQSERQHWSSDSSHMALVGRLTVARISLGDEDCFEPWLDWLVAAEAPGWERDWEILMPLSAKPDDPAMLDAARGLLSGHDSHFNLLRIANTEPYKLREMLSSPLVELVPVREAIDEMLTAISPVGEVSFDGEMVNVQYYSGAHSSFKSRIGPGFEPNATFVGKRTVARTCDIIAQHLARFEGAPTFALYWPKDVRNARIAEIRQFFRDLESPLDHLPEEYRSRPYR